MPIQRRPTDIRPAVKNAAYALGINPSRMAIMTFVSATPDVTVAQIADATGLRHSVISTHLSILQEAGLVELSEKLQTGKRPRFRARPDQIQKALALVTQAIMPMEN